MATAHSDLQPECKGPVLKSWHYGFWIANPEELVTGFRFTPDTGIPTLRYRNRHDVENNAHSDLPSECKVLRLESLHYGFWIANPEELGGNP